MSLCTVTGLHDPAPDGSCRDCEAVIGTDEVCADMTPNFEPDPLAREVNG